MYEELSTTWRLFYASVMSFQYHPGHQREGSQPLTPEQCARVADEMLEEYNLRRTQWVIGQRSQAQREA